MDGWAGEEKATQSKGEGPADKLGVVVPSMHFFNDPPCLHRYIIKSKLYVTKGYSLNDSRVNNISSVLRLSGNGINRFHSYRIFVSSF